MKETTFDNTGVSSNRESTNNIQIKYYGAIREAAGRIGDEALYAPELSVQGLLARFADVYGDGFRGEVFKENIDEFRDDLMLTVNEVVADRNSISDICLKPGDEIALFPLFPGGG
jgi:molybdopterin converting factor small subunit